MSIENPGHIAYELSELTLTAYESNPRNPGELTPLGTLTFLAGSNSELMTYPGLLAVRDVEIDPDRAAYFLVAHSQKIEKGSDRRTEVYNLHEKGYDFDALPLRPGDVLHLLYTSDQDRDGLPGRLEPAFRTDTERADSDGDGLSDFLEFTGWQTPCDREERIWVYPDPTGPDSDGDGVGDRLEWDRCTNPTETND